MNKFPVIKLFSRLGIWTIPLISLTFLPILWTYLQKTEAQAEIVTFKPIPALPPLSQLPSVSQLGKQSLKVPTPLISPASVLDKPQPQQKLSAKPPHASVLEKPQPQQKLSAKPSHASNSGETKSTSKKPLHASKRHSHSHSSRLVSAPPAYRPPQLEVKVAVLQNIAGSTIGTSAQALILDRKGRMLQRISGNQGLLVQANGSSLTVGNEQLPAVIWLQPTHGSFIYVGDRWYRGKMLLISQGGSLLAVNYVSLEEYLYSVVGSEMHANAPLEALKAQAIAARSYALVHIIRPASPWFDLGNDQRWQVYKGIGSEYNTTQHAVNQTAGQILSYKGGVVESLYAATDEIVARAHGGRGMSQIGAYDLAKQGFDYQQILGNYYPGVGLARLVLKQ